MTLLFDIEGIVETRNPSLPFSQVVYFILCDSVFELPRLFFVFVVVSQGEYPPCTVTGLVIVGSLMSSPWYGCVTSKDLISIVCCIVTFRLYDHYCCTFTVSISTHHCLIVPISRGSIKQFEISFFREQFLELKGLVGL